MTPVERSFEELNVGDRVSFTQHCSNEAVEAFAAVSGDRNPLHTDEAYAASTPFGKRVVHGMYLGSLCSRLIGMDLPGTRSLLMRMDLSFRNPVFVGESVEVTGTLVSKSASTGIVEIKLSVTHGDTLAADGTAHVRILS